MLKRIGHSSEVKNAPAPRASATNRLRRKDPFAKDSMQSSSEKPKEKGYVERAVLYLRDLVVWLFKRLFSFFRKDQEVVADDTSSVASGYLGSCDEDSASESVSLCDEDQKSDVDDISDLPEEIQRAIYTNIGRAQSSLEAQTFYREEILCAKGKGLAKRDPTLLKKYLNP